MRKVPLTLLFYLFAFQVFATHYRGGEITYTIIGPYRILATVTLYTKFSNPSNLADRDTIGISWGDSTTDFLPRINGVHDGSCTGTSPCGVIIATDIKQSVYEGVHQYAYPPPSDFYTLSFTDENLIGGIANINNGGSINVPIFLNASVYMGAGYHVLPWGFDASPMFLNPPKYYAFVSDTFRFNSAAYAPNSDSLSYSLVAPMISPNENVPAYVFPDDYCNQNVQLDNSLTIDSATGEVTWITPCTQGFFQIQILVKEYRCGFYLGSVARNMQIIVLPDADKAPQLTAVHDTVIAPGQMLEFNISATDSDVSNIDSIQILGAPFAASSHAPMLNTARGNPATASFSWQPDASFARPYSYLFTVVATDNFTAPGPDGTDPFPASDMKTFRVWVSDSATPCIISGVNNISSPEESFYFYPNPATSLLHIKSALLISTIKIMDLSGREFMIQKPQSNNCDLTIQGLENGVYLISALAGDLTITRKFIKIE